MSPLKLLLELLSMRRGGTVKGVEAEVRFLRLGRCTGGHKGA